MSAVGNKATRFGQERKEKAKQYSRSNKHKPSKKRIISGKDKIKAMRLKDWL